MNAVNFSSYTRKILKPILQMVQIEQDNTAFWYLKPPQYPDASPFSIHPDEWEKAGPAIRSLQRLREASSPPRLACSREYYIHLRMVRIAEGLCAHVSVPLLLLPIVKVPSGPRDFSEFLDLVRHRCPWASRFRSDPQFAHLQNPDGDRTS